MGVKPGRRILKRIACGILEGLAAAAARGRVRGGTIRAAPAPPLCRLCAGAQRLRARRRPLRSAHQISKRRRQRRTVANS